MAKRNACDAPVCKTTSAGRICPIMVPVYGKEGGCRERRREEFDSRSFFEVKSGKAKIVIGCLKGDYDAKARRCRKGTRALKLTIPKP